MSDDAASRERARIVAENARRARELPPDRYAPWDEAEQFMRAGRRRVAARLLHRAELFPRPGSAVLEVGCGEGAWLIDLLGWGLEAEDLWAIEIDEKRAATARRRLPGARVFAGDAAALPFAPASFDLVIASTVFSSVLDPQVQERIATEIVRVLRPGGVLLFYDFAIDNPRNSNVRGVPKARLRQLFPALTGTIESVTLAPPLGRALAPRALWLAHLFETLPFLRTHLLAVLRLPSA